MTLAYDGTDYFGWQVQPNGIALQAVVEQALSEFTGESIKVIASGRTDAGVHAIGQVISFETKATTPCRGFVHGLAPFLPADVVVRDAVDVPSGFNARYDAKRKWYRYVIHNSPIRLPFLRHAVMWQRSRLDEAAMRAAIQVLQGTHDFRCFETQWPNRSSSVRTIMHASVTRTSGWAAWDTRMAELPDAQLATSNEPTSSFGSAEPAFLFVDLQADGFLYNMVRTIVGTLIHIGRGRWTENDMRRILTMGDRTHAGETAPPQGLYLMRVDY